MRSEFRSKSILPCIVLAFSGFLVPNLPAFGEHGVTPEVQTAVLAENWKEVGRLLKEVDLDHPSAVLRLIKGHACLALNLNNEATCFFLSVQDEPSLETWQTWAERLAEIHPDNTAAWYLKGDALARAGSGEEALRAFGKALDISPRNALVLNARGVALASQGELRPARLDFADAVAAAEGRLADAHANIGALCLQRKDGARGGLEAFNEALRVNPDFALALHGRGLLNIILMASEESEKDFQSASEHLTCAGVHELMVANTLRYAAYLRGTTGQEFLASLKTSDEVGTTFHGRTSLRDQLTGDAQAKVNAAWSNYTRFAGLPGGQRSFNRYFEAYGQLQRIDPEGAARFHQNTVQPDMARSARIAKGHDDGLRTIGWTNDKFTSAMQAITVIGGAGGGAALAGAASLGTKAPIGGAAGMAGGGVWAGKMGEWRDIHNKTLANYPGYGTSVPGYGIAEGQFDVRRIMPPGGGRGGGLGGGPGGGPGRGFDRGFGGCDTDLSGVSWDEGDWPFAGYFGLAYPNIEDDLPLDEIRMAREALEAQAEVEDSEPEADKPE